MLIIIIRSWIEVSVNVLNVPEIRCNCLYRVTRVMCEIQSGIDLSSVALPLLQQTVSYMYMYTSWLSPVTCVRVIQYWSFTFVDCTCNSRNEHPLLVPLLWT